MHIHIYIYINMHFITYHIQKQLEGFISETAINKSTTTQLHHLIAPRLPLINFEAICTFRRLQQLRSGDSSGNTYGTTCIHQIGDDSHRAVQHLHSTIEGL